MLADRGAARPVRDILILRPSTRDAGKSTNILTQLKNEVCDRHKISLAGLEGPCRRAQFVAARTEFCWRAYALDCFSLPEIGRSIKRDHTTVMHHVRKWSK